MALGVFHEADGFWFGFMQYIKGPQQFHVESYQDLPGDRERELGFRAVELLCERNA